jgi:spermidine synthase
MNVRTRHIYPAVCFTTMSLLMLEVGLTRIFSVMFWYHFAYVIISLCLLGLGAAGSFLAVTGVKQRCVEALPRWAALTSLLFPVSIVGSFLLVTRIPFEPLALTSSATQFFYLLLIYLVVFIPFALGGVCVGVIVTCYSQRISRIYFFDLVGAGIGAVAVMLAINLLGAPAAIMVAALFASCASLYFFLLTPIRLRALPAFLVVIIGVLVVLFAVRGWRVRVPTSKELATVARSDIEFSRWSTVARVDVTSELRAKPYFGGDVSPRFLEHEYPARFVTQDGTAPTLIFKVRKDYKAELPFLAATSQSAVYRLFREPKVLAIGVGGGIDILVALYHGAREVFAVEVNPIMVELLTQRYADFTRGVFFDPRIHFIVNEGRHFLATTRDRFDIIQMSGVDTFAALSSGAYVLSENYLYTTEAISDVYDRLAPGGVYSVTRWYFEPPRETLRLVAIMVEALEHKGIAHPENHLLILRGRYWGTVLLKQSPWQSDEVEHIREFARAYEFEFFYDPFLPASNAFNKFLRASPAQRKRFIKAYPFDISPARDDRPFFFQYYKWSDALRFGKKPLGEGGYFITRLPLAHWTLLASLLQLVVLSCALIIVPLFKIRSGLRDSPAKIPFFAYFAALGLGFIFVEIVLIQRFIVYLGQPLYSIGVILALLLVFSGVGSYVSQRASSPVFRTLWLVLVALAFLLCMMNFATAAVIKETLETTFASKLLLTALLILPCGVLMGMPFPLGVRMVDSAASALVPWVWGINACFSVIGTMLAIFLSTLVGFSAVLLLAAFLYLAALIALLAARTEEQLTS